MSHFSWDISLKSSNARVYLQVEAMAQTWWDFKVLSTVEDPKIPGPISRNRKAVKVSERWFYPGNVYFFESLLKRNSAKNE